MVSFNNDDTKAVGFLYITCHVIYSNSNAMGVHKWTHFVLSSFQHKDSWLQPAPSKLSSQISSWLLTFYYGDRLLDLSFPVFTLFFPFIEQSEGNVAILFMFYSIIDGTSYRIRHFLNTVWDFWVQFFVSKILLVGLICS